MNGMVELAVGFFQSGSLQNNHSTSRGGIQWVEKRLKSNQRLENREEGLGNQVIRDQD
jgi:hypothetical protein